VTPRWGIPEFQRGFVWTLQKAWGLRLADTLCGLLAEDKEQSLDAATAYFTVGGFGLVKEGLFGLGSFRLLLGAEPTAGGQIGLNEAV